MCEGTLTAKDFSWEEKRIIAEGVAENLIARAREHRQEEVKEEDLFKVPATLREALTLHLLNFEWRPGDDSAQGMMAKQIALTIARTEDILQLDCESWRLSRCIEDHIETFPALDSLLSSMDDKVRGSTVAILLEALHNNAVEAIYSTLKNYIVIPKNKATTEVM